MTQVRSSLGLRAVRLFEGLAPSRLDALAQACRWRSLPAGRMLVQRAEHERDVHFVIDGQLRVTIFALNGRQLTFREVEAGGHFGELAAIDGQPRSADVLNERYASKWSDTAANWATTRYISGCDPSTGGGALPN